MTLFCKNCDVILCEELDCEFENTIIDTKEFIFIKKFYS